MKKCLAVFIKYPQSGQVKSRLALDIGADLAKDLYICFVEDILNKYSNKDFDLIFCIYPPEKLNDFKVWLGDKNFVIQEGENLGDKMKNTFISLFNKYNHVIVIGSDSPDLPIEIINYSFEKLQTDKKVIGKAIDGGYYLIGFNKDNFVPQIFEGIKWSTENVFKDTIKIFNQQNQSIYILKEWFDVDTIDDLKHLYKINLNSEFKSSKTMKFIADNIKLQ